MKVLLLSALFVGVAWGQAKIPAGRTPFCEGDSQPRSKRQTRGPPPCWYSVDANTQEADCSQKADTCVSQTPFVGVGQNHLCIEFSQNRGRWYKMTGTIGWCGSDNCCEWHPKGKCNEPRALPTWFPLPQGLTDCSQVADAKSKSIIGAEIMKGQEGQERQVCVLVGEPDSEDSYFETATVDMVHCGGNDCCIFRFRD